MHNDPVWFGNRDWESWYLGNSMGTLLAVCFSSKALPWRGLHVCCMAYTSVKVGRTHLASQTLLGITTETSLGINGALTLQWHLSGGRRLWDIALSRREGGGGKSKTVGLV